MNKSLLILCLFCDRHLSLIAFLRNGVFRNTDHCDLSKLNYSLSQLISMCSAGQ